MRVCFSSVFYLFSAVAGQFVVKEENMVFWCDCFQRNGYQQISTAAGGSQGMEIWSLSLKR